MATYLGQGRSTASLYEFAVSIAKDLDYDVEKAPAGASDLNGGRATLIPADFLIVHEDAGSLFDQAFLVAHEIGHAVLGDGSGEEIQLSIDPIRSAEPARMGVDRVVDYGRKQRREIQMDLFARELLLPRSVIRKWHLEEELSATAIADRVGAPLAFVSQQLLDALLMPPAETDSALQTDMSLNPQQRDAATFSGRALLLEAGPGTGKTQTVAGRVAHLLAQGVDPRRILLLTFSNKAASEMAERIARTQAEAAAAMWIGTFHAFGLDLIRRFHTELGLPDDPRILDRTEAVELIEDEFPRLGLTHYHDLYDPSRIIPDILDAISRAKDEVVAPDKYAELAAEMFAKAQSQETREAAEKAMEVARVYAAYERLKIARGCLDFGDLVLLPVKLLEENVSVRELLQSKYDHVLVDEYQDVNRSSVRLLSVLTVHSNIWVVGDAKQSIYRFRGASSFNISRFGHAEFTGAERFRLQKNYRSVPEIISAVSAFAESMQTGGAESSLEASRDRIEHSPELRTVDREDQQTVALAEGIEEMRQAGYDYRQQAVLCSGNDRLATLARDLERLGIPVLFLGSLFERPEVKDTLAFLSILVDRRAMGLFRVACWPGFEMELSDVVAVIDHLRKEDKPPLAWLQHLSEIPGLSSRGRAALTKLSATFAGFDQTSQPWDVLASLLLDRTRLAAGISESAQIQDRARGIALWQLLNFVRTQPAGQGLPIHRLLDRIRRLMRLRDDRDLRQLPSCAQGLNAVRLMTIHGAKGLEFPVVHFPGMNQDTTSRPSPGPVCPPPDGMVEGGSGTSTDDLREAQAMERECLFFVAISRAKDRLILYAPTQKSNGTARPLSPFLDRLGSHLSRRPTVPSQLLPPSPEESAIPVQFRELLRFSADQISLYEKCPRRFFYTHIAKVGGRRTPTAFTQMHEAVRSVVSSILQSGTTVITENQLRARLSQAFKEFELTQHGYSQDFELMALSMLRFFLSTIEGLTPESPTTITVDFGDEQVAIKPDQVLSDQSGSRVLRQVQTGHHRSSADKSVAAAAFVLAVQRAFPSARAEVVYLSDMRVASLTMSARELQNRREKLTGFLKAIRLGQFPAEVSAWVCPACPSFYICGPVPLGSFEKFF